MVATCNGVSPRLFLFVPGEQEIELCELQKFCSGSFLLFLPVSARSIKYRTGIFLLTLFFTMTVYTETEENIRKNGRGGKKVRERFYKSIMSNSLMSPFQQPVLFK